MLLKMTNCKQCLLPTTIITTIYSPFSW